MSRESKDESMDIFVNKALRGKPYLDIDRAITESKKEKKEIGETSPE